MITEYRADSYARLDEKLEVGEYPNDSLPNSNNEVGQNCIKPLEILF
jgi:hypothetical protein